MQRLVKGRFVFALTNTLQDLQKLTDYLGELLEC